MKPDHIPQDIWDKASTLATTRGAEGGLFTDNYVLPLAEALLAERKNATWADWTDPAHIKARLHAYEEIGQEDEFAFFPKIMRAMHVLVDSFTRDDDLTGFTVSSSRKHMWFNEPDYIESWRVLRRAIGRQVKGKHE